MEAGFVLQFNRREERGEERKEKKKERGGIIILFLVMLALIRGVRFDLSPSPLAQVKRQCCG